jgi:hypothetical protein
VLVFEAPVLLHHRGVGGQIGGVFTHQIVSKFVKRSGAKMGRLALLILRWRQG